MLTSPEAKTYRDPTSVREHLFVTLVTRGPLLIYFERGGTRCRTVPLGGAGRALSSLLGHIRLELNAET